jgi:hypothetical protein
MVRRGGRRHYLALGHHRDGVGLVVRILEGDEE